MSLRPMLEVKRNERSFIGIDESIILVYEFTQSDGNRQSQMVILFNL